MPTRARRARYVDMGRLREALRGPGVDTRVWIAAARVDDDPDAIRFDPAPPEGEGLGWIADVTFYGGPLDQEGPVPCRVGGNFRGSGSGCFDPISRGCEVVVLIADGDPNSNPVIIGQLSNADGCPVPQQVLLAPLTEALASVSHVVVSPHALRASYGLPSRLDAPTLALTGTQVFLGAEPATQAVVRGTQQLAALQTLVDALQVWTQAVAGALSGLGAPIAPAQTTLEGAITAFKTAAAAALSTIVKTE